MRQFEVGDKVEFAAFTDAASGMVKPVWDYRSRSSVFLGDIYQVRGTVTDAHMGPGGDDNFFVVEAHGVEDWAWPQPKGQYLDMYSEEGYVSLIQDGDAKKYDDGKPPVDLIPSDVLVEVARVLAHGAIKYDRDNWRKGMNWSRPYAATLRHVYASLCGEDIDPDSGLDHIDHALCELMFLRWYKLHNVGTDNRYKNGEKK